MDALYYLSSLIGVVWLVVWAIRQEGDKKQPWSPFDMREPDKPVKDKRYQQPNRAAGQPSFRR